jgi:hypothetical protein
MSDLSPSRAGFDLLSHDNFGTTTLILALSLWAVTSRILRVVASKQSLQTRACVTHFHQIDFWAV